ncbi:MAG: DUF1285 domain-containing protein [Syntrophales bacterium LBB04]|nr:DUF1285 domain-containing protein [Syntrophales bacterium LBB04]
MTTKIKADELPPSFIRIDKEGVWYYKGNEMFRKDIVNLFYQNLKRDESGSYYIELEDDLASLEVEDTAYVVTAVDKLGSTAEGNERISVLLNDETLEELNCESLRIGGDNVLYCTVKSVGHAARFLRTSYYQIAQYFDYDDAGDSYFLPLNGARYYIKNHSSH